LFARKLRQQRRRLDAAELGKYLINDGHLLLLCRLGAGAGFVSGSLFRRFEQRLHLGEPASEAVPIRLKQGDLSAHLLTLFLE
jgi:hypothetical protein